MDIWIINDDDKDCKIVSDAMQGELPMDNPYSMVFNLIKALGGRKLRHLTVLDHGNSSLLKIGHQTITPGNFAGYRWTFKQLRPHFAKDGSVRLMHCMAGQMPDLLKLFAETFGVPVLAGTGETSYNGGQWGSTTGVAIRCPPSPGVACDVLPWTAP